MKPRELIMAALSGTETDRIPAICPGGLVNILNHEIVKRAGIPLPAAHYSGEMMAELAVAARDMVGYDNLAVPLCMTVEAETLGARVDMGKADRLPHLAAFPEISLDRMHQTARPANLSHGRVPEVLKAITLLKRMRPALPIFASIASPATLLSFLLRPSEILRLSTLEGAMLELLVTDMIIYLDHYASIMVERGAEVIVIHDQISASEVLVEEGFDLVALYSLAELCLEIRAEGAKVIVHVCGNASHIMERLAKLEVDAFSFDSEVDVKEATAVLGKPVVGCVKPSLISNFPPEMVLEETLINIQKGARLMSPPCSLGMDVPLDNLKIICEAVHHF
jgi:MtaA/CmuA family methyltransferase